MWTKYKYHVLKKRKLQPPLIRFNTSVTSHCFSQLIYQSFPNIPPSPCWELMRFQLRPTTLKEDIEPVILNIILILKWSCNFSYPSHIFDNPMSRHNFCSSQWGSRPNVSLPNPSLGHFKPGEKPWGGLGLAMVTARPDTRDVPFSCSITLLEHRKHEWNFEFINKLLQLSIWR